MFRRLLFLCLLGCGGLGYAQTTITGTVYAPNGTDPLPNILVYVATPGVALTAFQPGPGTDCDHQNAVVSGNPIAKAITDYKGNFTLQSTGLTALGSATVNVVIQAGKWRRQYPNTVIVGNQANAVGTLAMPKDATQGDLPQIAVVTGSADAVECTLQSLGLNMTLEVTDVTGVGHINFFQGTQSPGAKATATSTSTELQLMSNQVPLSNYDVLMLGCQGTYEDSTKDNATYQKNLAAYANQGGRVFATHYEYVWLNKANTFASTAKWRPDESSITPNSTTGTITVDTSYSEGVILANWLQYIGASPAGTAGYGELPGIGNLRQDQTGVVAPTQSWGTLNPPYANGTIGTPVMQFTFDTPLGAATTPTVTMSFTNSPTNFLLGDTADTITINVLDAATAAPAQSGLTLTLTLPTGLTAVSLAGTNANTGWACSASSLTCIETANIAPGTSDPITLVVSVSTTATLGIGSVSAALAGGNLSNSGQCGRVLFNEYHVESGSSNVAFPKECPTVPQEGSAEKFLEFSLYNLSNFVAPVTADSVNIQSATVTALTNPNPSIYYGQIVADVAEEQTLGLYSNGSVDGGTINFFIDGVQVCTLPANTSGVCPAPTGQGYNVGVHSIQSMYSGDSLYTSSSSPIEYVTVNPDPTATTMSSSLNPSTVQQAVTLTAPVADQYITAAGTVVFYDGTIQIGSAPVNAAGVASLTVFFPIPGLHNLTACFQASLDYLGSCSAVTVQTVSVPVSPEPTVTTLVSNVNPSVVGQAVTFSASVGTTGSFVLIPAGTLTFYDGTNPLASVTLDSLGDGSYTTTGLALGTHSITAAYGGSTPALASTSAVLTQVVNTPLDSAASGFLMTVSPTSFSVGAGSSVSLGVTILDLSNFQQPVKLSCAGLPAEASCTFAQSTIGAPGGSTLLLVSPAAAHGCSTSSPYFVAGGRGLGLLWLGATAFGLMLARKRRKVLQGITLVAALCLLPMLGGCGNCTDFAVKPGTYTFSVTGTSTGSPVVVQTQAMTMTVTIK